MEYKVIASVSAAEDLENCLRYIIYKLKNEQAATSVLEDYHETINKLKTIAGSLPNPDSEKLKKHGYKKIRFARHELFMLYRIEGHTVYVDKIYHDLQDAESKIK